MNHRYSGTSFAVGAACALAVILLCQCQGPLGDVKAPRAAVPHDGRAPEALARDRTIPDAELLATADKLFVANRTRRALRLLKAMLAADRAPADVAMRLGEHSMNVLDYGEALQFFDRVLQINPAHSGALLCTGTVHYLANDFRRASFFLDLARKNGAKDPGLFFLLADSLLKTEKPARALLVIKDAPPAGRDLRLVELEGRALLILDWRADLRKLLEGVPSTQERARLRRAWYGDENIDGLELIEREFQFLY